MICKKCGAVMHQTDKNTMSGRVIREYDCQSCGHFDWEDDGVALWKLMHDARELDLAEAAARAAVSAAPESTKPSENPHTSIWQRLGRLFRGKK